MTEPIYFSKREKEVIKLLLQGKSNKEIASILGISISTVEFHLKNIFKKLDVKSRAEAIIKLKEMGFEEDESKADKEINLLLQGKSNKEIALILGISISTFEFHLSNIFKKLGVKTRAEAIAKLRESTGTKSLKPGESTVEGDGINADNEDDPAAQGRWQAVALFFRRHKFLILGGILLAIVLVWIFIFLRPKPMPWETYERECEYPDEATVGQMLQRSNASGAKVHGQFGTTASPPFPGQAGYVIYKNINLPQLDQLYLRLRYSKNSPSSVPILVYLDNETTPRTPIFPVDQHDWNQFTVTEPILLGSVKSGVHSLRFSTEGQQYGVADLDKLFLSR